MFNFGVLAHIIGPLCVGALINGHIPLIWKTEGRLRTFTSAGISGGVAIVLFWALLAPQRGNFDLSNGVTAFFIGSLFFILMVWLFEKSSAQQIIAAHRDKASSAEIER